jgi:muramidase (phage lysozyme)
MNNSVTGRILLTAQNQTKKPFDEISKQLVAMQKQSTAVSKEWVANSTQMQRASERAAVVSQQTALIISRSIASTVAAYGAFTFKTDEMYRGRLVMEGRIQQSLENTGKSGRIHLDQMRKYAEELAKTSSFTSDQILAAEETMTRHGDITDAELQRRTKIVANYAAATQQSIEQASEQIDQYLAHPAGAGALFERIGKPQGQEFDEQMKILQEYDDQVRAGEEIFETLGPLVRDQAVVLKQAEGAWGDLMKTLREFGIKSGEDVDPALQDLYGWVDKIVKQAGSTEFGRAASRIAALGLGGSQLGGRIGSLAGPRMGAAGAVIGAAAGVATGEAIEAARALHDKAGVGGMDVLKFLKRLDQPGPSDMEIWNWFLEQLDKLPKDKDIFESLFGKQSSLENQNQNFKESNRLLTDFNDNLQKVNDKMLKLASYSPPGMGTGGFQSASFGGISGGGIWGPSILSPGGGGGAPGGYQEPPASMLPPSGGQPINVGGAGVYTPPPSAIQSSGALPPEARALLEGIASVEAGPYGYQAINSAAGGGAFPAGGEHPFTGQKGVTAAGRYQMLASNWDRIKKQLNLQGGFTPENQDKSAWYLAQTDYNRRTGRNLQADLANPNMRDYITSTLAPTWLGLGAQPGKAMAAMEQASRQMQGSLGPGRTGTPSGFIMHHTGGRGGVAGVEATLRERGLGIQYIMDREGNITATGVGVGGASHMRVGQGIGKGLSNRNTVGMEIIAKNDKDINDKQIAAAKAFIAKNYPNVPVFGHGEVNPHKQLTEGHRIAEAIRAQRAALGHDIAKPPVAAKPPTPLKPPITQEQAQVRSGVKAYDPLASYKSAQRIYGEAYERLKPPAPVKPPVADTPNLTRARKADFGARDPVRESVQPGLAKQRDPMELLQQPRQDVQLGRGKVDLNLKLDRNVSMVRPSIEPAENFDLGVSVDRTGQFFARPGDPSYSGSGVI